MISNFNHNTIYIIVIYIYAYLFIYLFIYWRIILHNHWIIEVEIFSITRMAWGDHGMTLLRSFCGCCNPGIPGWDCEGVFFDVFLSAVKSHESSKSYDFPPDIIAVSVQSFTDFMGFPGLHIRLHITIHWVNHEPPLSPPLRRYLPRGVRRKCGLLHCGDFAAGRRMLAGNQQEGG